MLGRKNGKSRALVVRTGVANDDGWADATRGPSRVWLVVKLPVNVKEGDWQTVSLSRGGRIDDQALTEADSGLEAIQALYWRIYKALAEDDYPEADGRYIALDFYGGGARVEALVQGEWKVDVKVAPPTLGPTRGGS